MSFMEFSRNNAMTARARNLNNCALDPPKQYDWEILNTYGLTEKFETQLTWVHEDGFYDDELLRVFKNEQPAYKELVVEFLASFKIDDTERNETFNAREIITFRLLGTRYTFNLMEFGILLGLQEPNVDRERYHDHLSQATIGEAPGFNLHNFWQEIGMVEYNPRNSREAHLKNPLLRLIHRYLAWTILYNASPEKINVMQIKGLHYCMHRENRWNIPYAMALMFRAIQRTEGNELPGGQFITTIATNLEVLTPQIRRPFARAVKRELKGINAMTTAMILKKENGGYRAYGDFEGKPGMEGIIIGSQGAGSSGAGASSSRQTRRRTAERSEREEVPINLEHVARQNDQLGYYNDDIQQMIWAADQRAQARFMTTYSGELPPMLYDDFSQLSLWDERMGYQQSRRDQGDEDDDE